MTDSKAFIKHLSTALSAVNKHKDHEIFLEVRQATSHFCRKNVQIRRPGEIVKSEIFQFSLQIILFLKDGLSGSLSIHLDECPDDVAFLVETVLQQCRVKSQRMTQIEAFDFPFDFRPVFENEGQLEKCRN